MKIIYLGNIAELAMALWQMGALSAWITEASDGIVTDALLPNVPHHEVENATELKTIMKALEPIDLAVMGNFGLIVPADILSIPKHGFWNMHYGLLPEYPGRYPVEAMIRDGQVVVGVTLHQATQKLDEGTILNKAQISVGDIKDTSAVMMRLIPLSLRVLTRTLETRFSRCAQNP